VNPEEDDVIYFMLGKYDPCCNKHSKSKRRCSAFATTAGKPSMLTCVVVFSMAARASLIRLHILSSLLMPLYCLRQWFKEIQQWAERANGIVVILLLVLSTFLCVKKQNLLSKNSRRSGAELNGLRIRIED
jgi:hypothetical protein